MFPFTPSIMRVYTQASSWQGFSAHEMAHVRQQTHGSPPRSSYHDRQWAAKMKEIGLQPSTTGEPGGIEAGQSVTHYIIPGGPHCHT